MDVHEAANVAEASSLLAAVTFDAIVSDQHLPDGTGHALLRCAATLQAHCRRVMMSGAPLDAPLEEAVPFFSKVGGLGHVVAWVLSRS